MSIISLQLDTETMFDRRLLKGKVALVTGSTSGIGLRSAEHLARAGCGLVILNGRSESSGQKALAELRELVPEGNFELVIANYLRPEGLDRLFGVAEQRGGLDILVHPALPEVEAKLGPFMDSDAEEWSAMVDGLYLSFVHCCHRAARQMITKGGGAIISIASDAAKLATPGEAVNGGALAANVMFCRAVALELARHNVRVNAVTPSITRGTGNYDKMMSKEFSRRLFQKAEARARLGVAHAENVAPMVVFLASSLASHITGQAVSVNGGISAA